MDSIIFDVDGTLWNSTEIIAKAWTDCVRKEYQLDMTITPEMLMSVFGQLLPDIAKKIFPRLSEDMQLEVIEACCDAEHRALLKTCAPLYKNLEYVLKELSKSYPLYIVSNCQAGYIEVFLESTGFGHYFSGHLCPGDTGMAKADNIRKIVADNGLSDPVYVGDTDGDHNACKKSGVPFIFAAYGFGQTEHPDYVIQEPEDLLKLCL
ncbi:MAG: HAD family hydrolase [Blautia sp.]|nr:HAD family hydrolase [Blautia sp.]